MTEPRSMWLVWGVHEDARTDVVVAVCDNKTAAKRAAEGKGVFGSSGWIEERIGLRCENPDGTASLFVLDPAHAGAYPA